MLLNKLINWKILGVTNLLWQTAINRTKVDNPTWCTIGCRPGYRPGSTTGCTTGFTSLGQQKS